MRHSWHHTFLWASIPSSSYYSEVPAVKLPQVISSQSTCLPHIFLSSESIYCRAQMISDQMISSSLFSAIRQRKSLSDSTRMIHIWIVGRFKPWTYVFRCYFYKFLALILIVNELFFQVCWRVLTFFFPQAVSLLASPRTYLVNTWHVQSNFIDV